MTVASRMLCTFAISAVAAFGAPAATALTYQDIAGKWCTDAGTSTFTRESLLIFRYSDKASFNFRITRYELQDKTIVVHWVKSDGSSTITTYGRFGPDVKSMVQLSTQEYGERPHRRC